jgi:predicted DNA-binding protein (MmcQ/YjbR family)
MSFADRASSVPAMTASQLRAWCLGRPGAVEEFPFTERVSVFKVGGKMFALGDLDAKPLRVSLKCEPELAESLRAAHDAVGPGYHLNKRHWNTVVIDGTLPDEVLVQMLEDSYDLVVAGLTRAQREALPG